MKEFDYYIFVDYSENLIGYSIIEKCKLKELLPRISRFKHFRVARNKKLYLKNVKKTIERENICSSFLKLKIQSMSNNMEIYLDTENSDNCVIFSQNSLDRELYTQSDKTPRVPCILEFLKKYANCIIFISVDNKQYPSFRKMIHIVDGNHVVIKQESELREGTPEYQVSLVLDNLLNIERIKKYEN